MKIIAIKSPYSQNNYMYICKYINDSMRIKKEKPRIQCYNSTTSSFHTEMQKLKKCLLAEFVFLSIRKIIKFTETHSEKYSRPLTCRNRVTWPPIYRKVSNSKQTYFQQIPNQAFINLKKWNKNYIDIYQGLAV